MRTFPLLKTGAITQYPATAVQKFSTDLVVFMDGTEQRSRKLPGPAMKWVVNLAMLDESEMRWLEEFYIEQSGSYASFRFTDPWTSKVYPDCSFQEDTLQLGFEAQDRGKLRLTVVENRQ